MDLYGIIVSNIMFGFVMDIKVVNLIMNYRVYKKNATSEFPKKSLCNSSA
jgi:hypothetical protein